MNKTQLYRALLKGHPADERIFFRPILMHFAARFNNTTYGKFASDYKTLVESNIRAMEFFDTDMVSLISDPYRETSAFGARIQYVDEGVPRCLDKIVNSFDDVKNLPDPDVYKCERTLDRIKGAEYYQKLLKGSVPVSGWIEGPLAEACDLAGVDEMLIRLMTDPDLSNTLMDKCMVTAKKFAKAQIDAGCDLIGIGDAICSQIDRDTYDLYIRDRHKELISYIHECGAQVKLHICGNITHLLESLSEVNTDIIDLDWQVDIDLARTILGNNVVIGGNINPVLIQDKTAEEVYNMSEELVNRYWNQKYLLAGGCEITVLTPHDNLLAMRRASILKKNE
ncbi:MAG: uroporphyrinogen decarboxylase family protein [Bacteroidales bacterium]|nr:uroporphyrinogen decarboxylase family protein [Bacteroidales bacterium]